MFSGVVPAHWSTFLSVTTMHSDMRSNFKGRVLTLGKTDITALEKIINTDGKAEAQQL